MMYRHRPAFPALIGAAASLLFGAFCYAMLSHQVKYGEADARLPLTAAFAAVAVALIFLVAAFSRYQFTHLWLKSPPKTKRRQARRM